MANNPLQEKHLQKVLIVEDEGDMCLLLNIMLNGKVDLDHVKSIQSAEDYLQKEKPALVILDNKLPDGFGIDYITYIKKNYPDVRIIMISGYDGSARDVAMENGADIFLEKPFTKSQLFDAITTMLQSSQKEAIA